MAHSPDCRMIDPEAHFRLCNCRPTELTWDEWRELGFVVKKGEKAVGVNTAGIAEFSAKSVKRPDPKCTLLYEPDERPY